MKETTITCDVIDCGKRRYKKVDCCRGWIIEDDLNKLYKKMEKPTNVIKTDLCEKHWKEWCKLTIKLLRMNKEVKNENNN